MMSSNEKFHNHNVIDLVEISNWDSLIFPKLNLNKDVKAPRRQQGFKQQIKTYPSWLTKKPKMIGVPLGGKITINKDFHFTKLIKMKDSSWRRMKMCQTIFKQIVKGTKT